ncbi:hypothetical protein F2P56_015769, partial [Juglans regia]
GNRIETVKLEKLKRMEVGGQKWLCVALVFVLAIFHTEAVRIRLLGEGEVFLNLKSKQVQERDLSKGLYYGMKPKGVPIPPSGPSKRTSDSPPRPPHDPFHQALSKGPVPPSAPNPGPFDTSTRPPLS